MKTFKGRARGWFYADQLLRAAKENLDSSGCGEGEEACRVSTPTNLPRGSRGSSPGQRKGMSGEDLSGRGRRPMRREASPRG